MKNKAESTKAIIFAILYGIWFSSIEAMECDTYFYTTRTIDTHIPFLPSFVIPYIFWFIYMAAGLLFLYRYKKKTFEECLSHMIIGMSFFLIISSIFPTAQDLRPQITGSSVTEMLTKAIYAIDTPTNVLPSLHVYNTLCVMNAYKEDAVSRICAWSAGILIILSTVFIKQHSILDVSCAILLFAFILVISGSRKEMLSQGKIHTQIFS